MAAFTKVADVEVHRGFRISLHAARFRAADGTEFEREVVHHPGAVAVVPLHEDGTVTLVRQFRSALEHDLLELPAGLRDVDGEADPRTAERELEEEAGLAADRLEHLVTFHNSPGFCDESVSIFLAEGLRSVAGDPQGIEELHMTIERFALEDALAMVDDGRITDAKTIIGLTLTAARRRG